VKRKKKEKFNSYEDIKNEEGNGKMGVTMASRKMRKDALGAYGGWTINSEEKGS